MLVLTFAALLGGCWASGEPAKPYRTKAQRVKDAEMAVSKTPVPRTYRFADGALVVIDVPVKDGSGFVDVQRCFVWRDEAYRSSSLSCGQMPDVLLNGAVP